MADETKNQEPIEAPITINIGNLCDGRIIDAFAKELQKCLDNIYDMDTPATTTRTITLKVKLKPDDSRAKIAAQFDCDSSLAQPHPVTDVFFVGKDKETGQLFGLLHDPRQMAIVPEDGNYKAMLQVCSNLKAGSSIQTADDGYSQKVTVQEGGVERGSVDLPPRITLKPYRTFREITPVGSDFLLRFKAVKDSLPSVALISVDGGRWKMDSVVAIGEWLAANLPDATTVIA